jgi:hypothetical protein
MREFPPVKHDHVSDRTIEANPLVGSFRILSISDMKVPGQPFTVSETFKFAQLSH